jgi:hypothetical protein
MRISWPSFFPILLLVAVACSRQPPSDPIQPAALIGPDWRVTFQLDSANRFISPPTGREVTGLIVLTDSAASDQAIVEARRGRVGRYRIDFTPFFGAPFAKDVSTSVVGPTSNEDFLTRVHWWISGRQLVVVLTPQMSHGPVAFFGRLYGDSIAGTWYQRAYCCGAYGRFVMRRASR